eukprot:CAMPEP_0202857604 /NCGR_PEP_ID=MMETSP1391-20130828/481_1 /ASSEMBLY_ACC=CAM_ASM_000867 /TAXON_ID=1034604 /ORGANISM="Chlamydomonas leiostraca, Strain SAG 11-49" /LENGTH=680 /DNA_ID=CAMNT_0049536423 /DNA_START=160 /DNA_END=2202 /DNA_ORIENTATION=-
MTPNLKNKFDVVMKKKRQLIDDLESLINRPYIAGPIDAVLNHRTIQSLPQDQPQVYAQLLEVLATADASITQDQVKWVVRVMEVITHHPAVYSVLPALEVLVDNERTGAVMATLDRVITPARMQWGVGVLHATMTPARYDHIMALAQAFFTDARINQLLDVADVLVNEAHMERAVSWTDALSKALVQDDVVKLVDTIQVALSPKERVVGLAASLDKLVTVHRAQLTGKVLDAVLTPQRFDRSMDALDEVDTPERMARMSPVLRRLISISASQARAYVSALATFLAHPAAERVLGLMDSVAESGRAARYVDGLEAALTPQRQAWLVDALAGSLDSHDGGSSGIAGQQQSVEDRAKVMQEARLLNLVALAFMRDQKTFTSALDMLGGVLLTPARFERLLTLMDGLLEPHRAARWADAIETVALPLLPPPNLLSHLRARSRSPGASPSPSLSPSPPPSIPTTATGDAAAIASAASSTMDLSSLSSGGSMSSMNSMDTVTLATVEQGAVDAAASSATPLTSSAKASSPEPSTPYQHAQHSASHASHKHNRSKGSHMVEVEVKKRVKFLKLLATGWYLPVAATVLDWLLPECRIQRLLRATDTLLASPAVLCELRALAIETHKALHPGKPLTLWQALTQVVPRKQGLECPVLPPQALAQRWARLLWRLHVELAIERGIAQSRGQL